MLLSCARRRQLTSPQAAPPELLAEAAAEPLGKLLLPRLAVRVAPHRRSPGPHAPRPQDGSERCRQVAAEATLALLQRAPVAALALLPYAVPVLRERLVHDGAARPEPSEARPAVHRLRRRTAR